jgi:ABC-type glycerol-3-phosphate transport system substrate-binding protein
MLHLMGATTAGMALAGCVPAAVPQGGQAGEAAPAAAGTVIKFDAGGFTPSKYTGQQLTAGQTELVGFEVVTQAYKEIKPEVTIEFQANPMGNRREASVTMLSGGTAPDILWAQPDWVNEDLGKGWWLDLDPFMELPNAYAPADHPGRQSWHDSFYPSIDFWRAPDGHLYMLLGDQTALGVYYNKDLFQEVGISAERPASWAEMMAFGEALKGAGYPGYAWVGSGEPALHPLTWVSGWLSKYFFWSKIPVYDQDANGWPDKWEIADAVQEGTYNATMDEQVARLRTLKEMAQYWQEGALGTDQEASYRLFLSGGAGMCITGVWMLSSFLNDPERQFELGWFYFPPVTQDTSSLIPADVPMTNVASGYGSFQYSLTATAQNNGTTEMCADFLMFATTPENIEKIVNETPSTIPNVKGTTSHPTTQELGFAETVQYAASSFQEDDSLLDFEYGMNFMSVVLPYCVDQMSEEDMLSQLQGYMDVAAERIQAIRPA